MNNSNTPVLGFLAHSGTGKTTLLTKLITILRKKNYRIGMIKNAHHDFEIDKPGKDSYKLRKAGANKMLIGTKKHWALMVDADKEQTFSLSDHIMQLQNNDLDLILVEGFTLENMAKIELIRHTLGHDFFFPQDKDVIAIATDDPHPIATDLPILDINNPDAIINFIEEKFLSS